jgi:hypothetical protein
MIVVIRPGTPRDQIDFVIAEVQKLGYDPVRSLARSRRSSRRSATSGTHHTLESLTVLPQVERVLPVQKRHKLVSRESHPGNSLVNVDGVVVGGEKFTIMAGPCSVESEEQLMTTAEAVKAAGATILRGGAYKPRTSPYEFQGLGKEGLRMLAKAKQQTGAQDHHRTPQREPRGARRRSLGRAADRRAQRTELPAPRRRGAHRQARPAQAWPERAASMNGCSPANTSSHTATAT